MQFFVVAIPVAALLAYGLIGDHEPSKSFANCKQAHAAGRYNIKRTDPEYRSKLDSDNDGLACEPYGGNGRR